MPARLLPGRMSQQWRILSRAMTASHLTRALLNRLPLKLEHSVSLLRLLAHLNTIAHSTHLLRPLLTCSSYAQSLATIVHFVLKLSNKYSRRLFYKESAMVLAVPKTAVLYWSSVA